MLPELRYMNGEERNTQMTIVIEDALQDETDEIACLATTASYIAAFMERVSWVGFYMMRHDTLVIGPFQGPPACVRIAIGKGVCGTAAAKRETIVVADVNSFDGYISCDSATRSEIVVPVIVHDELYAVLDIDSPEYGRFQNEDKLTIEKCAELVARCVERTLAVV